MPKTTKAGPSNASQPSPTVDERAEYAAAVERRAIRNDGGAERDAELIARYEAVYRCTPTVF